MKQDDWWLNSILKEMWGLSPLEVEELLGQMEEEREEEEELGELSPKLRRLCALCLKKTHQYETRKGDPGNKPTHFQEIEIGILTNLLTISIAYHFQDTGYRGNFGLRKGGKVVRSSNRFQDIVMRLVQIRDLRALAAS